MDMTYLKYPVYFLSGSLLITAITLIAEKKSQKVAGILMCLPVITFLSLLFLGISQGTDFASRAAVWNPIGAIADLVYLGFFAIGINIPGYTAAARNESIRRKKIVELLCGLFFGFTGYFISILIFRGIFGGSAVAAVVILGDSFGYLWGGLFSSFPATITPVLVLLHMRNGKDIISGVIKSSPIGLSATGLYSCMVWLLYPLYGIITGTLASYIAVFVFLSMLFYGEKL
ncbi:MAG: hypothetical protein KKG76_11050 [Euryarchaeota archaeon]|nr:hypothetical protein [Euryarchaeota archaeon]